ncbi:MAG: hypothetical protein Fur0046_36770 [Cyanobacteria bacterium J069]|nr:MAG: small multidrug resistance protein [Cyanobacteria bacterium J069]
MLIWISISAAVCYTIGGVFMQLSEGLTRFTPSLMIYVCFLGGASLQTYATRLAGVMGLSYILVLGLEAVLSVLFSVLIFREGYTSIKIAGLMLTVLGVALLRAEIV